MHNKQFHLIVKCYYEDYYQQMFVLFFVLQALLHEKQNRRNMYISQRGAGELGEGGGGVGRWGVLFCLLFACQGSVRLSACPDFVTSGEHAHFQFTKNVPSW